MEIPGDLDKLTLWRTEKGWQANARNVGDDGWQTATEADALTALGKVLWPTPVPAPYTPKPVTPPYTPKPVAHSYSALKAWRDCPRLHREKHVRKSVKDPGSAAMQRGSRVHKDFERAITNPSHQIAEVQPGPKIAALLRKYQTAHAAQSKVLVEQKFALNRQGKPVDFFAPEVWLRSVADVAILSGSTAIVTDWKTGKVRVDPLQADVTDYVIRRALGVDAVKFLFAYVEHDHLEDATPASDTTPVVEGLIEQVEADLQHEAQPRKCYMCRFCPVKWCEFNEA